MGAYSVCLDTLGLELLHQGLRVVWSLNVKGMVRDTYRTVRALHHLAASEQRPLP